MRFKLPIITYMEYDGFVGETTMRLHHNKHHKGYVDNLNQIWESCCQDTNGFVLKRTVFDDFLFHAGGHVNHSFFWKLIERHNNYDNYCDSHLKSLIMDAFNNVDRFEQEFMQKALSIKGSGWCWLLYNEQVSRLSIVSTMNQDPVLDTHCKVLLGLDMWEHAYYLKFYNDKKSYIKAFFQYIGWDFVSRCLLKDEYFGDFPELYKELRKGFAL